jgi:hypothetical protein
VTGAGLFVGVVGTDALPESHDAASKMSNPVATSRFVMTPLISSLRSGEARRAVGDAAPPDKAGRGRLTQVVGVGFILEGRWGQAASR